MLETSAMFPSPEWVIFGFGGGPNNSVGLVASNTLSYSELKCEWEQERVWEICVLPSTTPDMTLFMRMKNCYLIYAPTYKEALARLMQEWQPESTPRTALTSGSPLSMWVPEPWELGQ